MSSEVVNYYSPNFDLTEKEVAQRTAPSYCKVPIWTPKEGQNLIRILPPWNERGLVFKVLALHWFGSKNNRVATLCLRQFQKRCYICEIIQKLLAAEVLTKETARVYYAVKRAFCNGLDLKELDKGVQIMSLPIKKVVQSLINYAKDPEYGDFTHPENGYDIKIEKETAGLYPDYNVIPARKSSPLPDRRYLKELYNLDDFENIWIVHSYDEQKELWNIYADVIRTEEEESNEIEEPKLPEDIPLEVGKKEIDLGV